MKRLLIAAAVVAAICFPALDANAGPLKNWKARKAAKQQYTQPQFVAPAGQPTCTGPNCPTHAGPTAQVAVAPGGQRVTAKGAIVGPAPYINSQLVVPPQANATSTLSAQVITPAPSLVPATAGLQLVQPAPPVDNVELALQQKSAAAQALAESTEQLRQAVQQAQRTLAQKDIAVEAARKSAELTLQYEADDVDARAAYLQSLNPDPGPTLPTPPQDGQ